MAGKNTGAAGPTPGTADPAGPGTADPAGPGTAAGTRAKPAGPARAFPKPGPARTIPRPRAANPGVAAGGPAPPGSGKGSRGDGKGKNWTPSPARGEGKGGEARAPSLGGADRDTMRRIELFHRDAANRFHAPELALTAEDSAHLAKAWETTTSLTGFQPVTPFWLWLGVIGTVAWVYGGKMIEIGERRRREALAAPRYAPAVQPAPGIAPQPSPGAGPGGPAPAAPMPTVITVPGVPAMAAAPAQQPPPPPPPDVAALLNGGNLDVSRLAAGGTDPGAPVPTSTDSDRTGPI